MPFTVSCSVLARRNLDGDRRADAQVVVLGVVVVHERAVRSECCERLLRAFRPLQGQHLVRVLVDCGHELHVAEDPRLAGARARDRLDAGHLRRGLGGVGRDRREVVLRRDRVVGREDVVDGAAEGARDPGRERRHERDEREPDHQRGGGRAALRVARALSQPVRFGRGTPRPRQGAHEVRLALASSEGVAARTDAREDPAEGAARSADGGDGDQDEARLPVPGLTTRAERDREATPMRPSPRRNEPSSSQRRTTATRKPTPRRSDSAPIPIQSRICVVPRPLPNSPKRERGEAEAGEARVSRPCGSGRSATRAASPLRAPRRSAARASPESPAGGWQGA